MKYTMQDKARILRTTTRTLQRWRTTKPELYAIIEAGFNLYEMIESEEEITKDIKNILKESLKK
ncbi:MAG: hypothetical protein IKK93_08790 [Campylobacter sp.]|nr:hypothetical protein [Campylobacter sp.]